MLVRLPVQEPAPAEVSPNSACLKVLRAAQDLQKKQGDSHTAVDHLLLAVVQDRDIEAALKESGLNYKQIETAVAQVRGGRKVDSKSAESNYEALTKYGRDLVADAEAGKLDPVIGRDDEIRRVIRVLSRRTK